MSKHLRPEHTAPPEVYYDETEAAKYTSNTRVIKVQDEMTNRAIELLCLPEDETCLLLDVGCGSGLSGEAITESGHMWMGIDISRAMLDVAVEREVEGDVIQSDMGDGLFFRPGTFDGVVSISALQWLCNADKKSHHPPKRLTKFFNSLYGCMKNGSRAVFQLYPETNEQLELITKQATKAGFGGGVVVDYPNSTKAKKFFLCLYCGNIKQKLPQAYGTGGQAATSSNVRARVDGYKKKGSIKGDKEWILAKKERRRRQGKETREDTKFTGRKRRHKF